ncbi:hypothetical protein Glove_151g131 [Diversispora epigaea]|uniref:Protein kinase domain-containing protein n=1 Tax=Diversispora epigaea TaxID=1348612 RepID=A0A397IZH1_9GLOM|nr:hypothetical protein Glove_151g131 [Diversispora epigaea]
MEIHLEANAKYADLIQFYGITQDPETHSYMMNIFGVLPYIAPEVLSGGEYTKAVESVK